MNNSSDDDKDLSMPASDTAAEKKQATRTSRNIVALFQSRGGFTGRLESMAGSTTVMPPTDEDVRNLASNIATAVRDDPLAFGILGQIRTESQIRDQLAGVVDAINRDGQRAMLTEPQQSALEAIVLLTGRPVLFIKNDTFDLPTGQWELLAPYREEISAVAKSVGRIGVSMDYGTPYVGSGFVVAPGLVMTNRHVVNKFVSRTADGWTLDPGCQMMIDFKQEFGVAEKREFPITSVVWVDDRENVDLALIKVDDIAAQTGLFPSQLRLQKESGYVNQGNNIYVIGYPAADTERNDLNEMQRIFVSVYEKKRLAPGRISSIDTNVGYLNHDCSTLGGNSGSCIVDLSTNSVIGLHFEGRYLDSNIAVLLPALSGDPQFRTLNWQVGRDA